MEKTRRVKREGRVVRAVARAYVLLTQKTIKPYESGIITFYQVIPYPRPCPYRKKEGRLSSESIPNSEVKRTASCLGKM